MSEHRAQVAWTRDEADFDYETYPRNHLWRFEPGAIEVPASAAAAYLGDDARVDPEQAFVAALSSCHMLTFLAIAARKRLAVDSYDDNAVGYLEKDQEGHLAVTRVVLRPQVRFAAGVEVDAAQLQRLHDGAHRNCFIANSVRTKITVEA